MRIAAQMLLLGYWTALPTVVVSADRQIDANRFGGDAGMWVKSPTDFPQIWRAQTDEPFVWFSQAMIVFRCEKPPHTAPE